MPHLIEPIKDASLSACLAELRKSYDLISKRIPSLPVPGERRWAGSFKRILVTLGGDQPIECHGNKSVKDTEQFFEVVNQLATVERLMDCLEWLLGPTSRLECARVRVCHPCTSSAPGENDLVLEDSSRKIVARIEVTDVISRTKDSNKKGQKTLLALMNFTEDSRSFFVTSPEHASLILRKKKFRLEPRCEEPSSIIEVLRA